MDRITNGQTVATAAASLILFSAAMSAGYVLAGDGKVVAASTPRKTEVAALTDFALKPALNRDEPRIEGRADPLNTAPAQAIF